MKLNNIRLIEIELFSQCNRQCKFCPNSFIDRHSTNIEMNDEVFEKVIDELVEIKYKKYISFSRYNEPFMHIKILRKRVDYIKQKLPDAKLVSNTNSDYDTTTFEKDIDITHMDYSKPLTFKINNRGGSLKGDFPLRTLPCLEPTYFIGIDYTGDIVPCCNIRHDIELHKNYILGNVKNNTLYDILNTRKAKSIRSSVKHKLFTDVCKYCTKGEGRYTKNE